MVPISVSFLQRWFLNFLIDVTVAKTFRLNIDVDKGNHPQLGSVCEARSLPLLCRDKRLDKSQVSKMQKGTFLRGLQGQHTQAVSTRTGRSWSASSSSGDGEDQALAYKASGQKKQKCVS